MVCIIPFLIFYPLCVYDKEKKKLALFDLDDTLFDGDTEGEWVTFMHKNGFIEDSSFFKEMEEFEKITEKAF